LKTKNNLFYSLFLQFFIKKIVKGTAFQAEIQISACSQVLSQN